MHLQDVYTYVHLQGVYTYVHLQGVYTYVYLQGVSGGIVNILGGGGMDYSE
jgi:hypothetical protein